LRDRGNLLESPGLILFLENCSVAVSAGHFDADPDPTFHFDADPDPTFHFDADLDSTPYQSYAYIETSTAPL
jgi:hypothetical protein